MKRVIWKYLLQLRPTQQVIVPISAVPLSVGEQDGELCIWFEVNPDAQKTPMTINIVGTGDAVPGRKQTYCGTVQVENTDIGGNNLRRFVWHIYLEH